MAHFDSDRLPLDERFAEFERITPGYDLLLPEGCEAPSFNCYGWLLDDLVLTASDLGAMGIQRTPAHIRSYARDTYTFVLTRRGRWWAELDYGTVHVSSGQICILDFTRPWHLNGTDQRSIMLVIPRALVHAAVPDAPHLHGRLLDGAGGRIFAEHLVALVRHLPEMKQGDVPLIRDATIALLSGALAGIAPRNETPAKAPAMRAASIVRLHAFIDDNLMDPNLSAAQICRELAVTRPTLYRALAASGGVASFIQRRRLEAAHSKLLDATSQTSLAEIADEYCFSSPSHFSTAFRRRFGYTPRDARASPRRVGGTIDLFSTYLEAVRGKTTERQRLAG